MLKHIYSMVLGDSQKLSLKLALCSQNKTFLYFLLIWFLSPPPQSSFEFQTNVDNKIPTIKCRNKKNVTFPSKMTGEVSFVKPYMLMFSLLLLLLFV